MSSLCNSFSDYPQFAGKSDLQVKRHSYYNLCRNWLSGNKINNASVKLCQSYSLYSQSQKEKRKKKSPLWEHSLCASTNSGYLFKIKIQKVSECQQWVNKLCIFYKLYIPLVCHKLVYMSLAVQAVLSIRGAKVMECGHENGLIQRKKNNAIHCGQQRRRWSVKQQVLGKFCEK